MAACCVLICFPPAYVEYLIRYRERDERVIVFGEINDMVASYVPALKAKGLESPHLKSFIVDSSKTQQNCSAPQRKTTDVERSARAPPGERNELSVKPPVKTWVKLQVKAPHERASTV